jgi:hypothetical protein
MKVYVYEEIQAKEKLYNELNFLEHNRITLRSFYKDLDSAINKKKNQSIWQLSKVITRYQLR